jgi:hypothetical protein
MIETSQLQFGINAPVKKIYAALKWIIAINIFFLVGTWLQADKVIFPTNVTAQWWLVELNFAKENVAASWYSSMLLFCSGIMASLCFWADMLRTENKAARLLNYGWLVIAGIFIMLSFDEMGSFHEMIGETGLFKKAGGGNGKLVFFVLIGAVAIFMAAFFFTKFKTNKLALLLTVFGLLLFLSNPFQEKFEIQSWRTSADPANWHRPVFYLLLEEGSEIFGSFCFLFSFIIYAVAAATGGNAANEKTLQLISPANKNFIAWLAGLAIMLGLMMWLIQLNAWNLPGDDNGVPQDWPPAASAFACFFAAVYLLFKKNYQTNRFIYFLIATASIFTSAYFGSYMYGYWEGPFAKMPYVLLTVTAIAGLAAAIKLKGLAAKIFFAAWIALTALSVFEKGFSATLYGYTGCTCLLLGLFLHYKSFHKPVVSA